jgi:hypothetical protein
MSDPLQEENDMPSVLPDAHEYMGNFEGLELNRKAHDARLKALEDNITANESILKEVIAIMANRETFRLSMLAREEDRATMVQVQGLILQFLGSIQERMPAIRQAGHAIVESLIQNERHKSAILALALPVYMESDRPEPNLTAPLTLPAIDLINPVMPKDRRLLRNYNVLRPGGATQVYYNNGNPEDVMYDPMGELHLNMQ